MSVMGTLVSTLENVEGGKIVARNSVAVLAATPLMLILAQELVRRYGIMAPSEAVVVFGIAAGATQFAMQGVGASKFKTLGRDIHVAEMGPPVVAGVASSLVLSWVLLPPSPLNFVTTAMRETGTLPS